MRFSLATRSRFKSQISRQRFMSPNRACAIFVSVSPALTV